MARTLPLLVVFSAVCLAACGERVEWTTVADGESRFRVEMPGAPQKLSRKLELPFGPAPMHMWVVEDGDRAFIVGYTEFPERVANVASEDELLDSARDRAVEGADGRLVREEPRELRGHRGRTIELDARGGAVKVRGALFLADSRLYQVLATTTPEEARSERVERFLASFDLPPPPPVASAGPEGARPGR